MKPQKVAISSGEMNFVRRGEGATLLLVHGFPLDHTMWRFQIDQLARRFTVIAPDLRGFGQSTRLSSVSMDEYADDLAELLTEIQSDHPVNFCGLSMGGYIGWQFWKRHGFQLNSLIACDTIAESDTPAIRRARLTMARQVHKQGTVLIAESMMGRLICEQTQAEKTELVEELKAVIRRADPNAISAAQLAMSERQDFIAELGSINIPTLVVVGQHDQISPPTVMRAMADQIPKAQYVEIPHAGHLSPLENPADFNRTISTFLDKVVSWTGQ